ncbi:MAG: hypothetical protein LQ352_003287 [Teloschistes flavicans]|nr:MAG: hypothetical protein LQ352_003287 [Teloschistes flavicans]
MLSDRNSWSLHDHPQPSAITILDFTSGTLYLNSTDFESAHPGAYCVYWPLVTGSLREIMDSHRINFEAQVVLIRDWTRAVDHLHSMLPLYFGKNYAQIFLTDGSSRMRLLRSPFENDEERQLLIEEFVNRRLLDIISGITLRESYQDSQYYWGQIRDQEQAVQDELEQWRQDYNERVGQ